MATKYPVAPEFRKLPRVPFPRSRWILRGMNRLLALQRRRFRWPDGVTSRTHVLHQEGAPALSVFEIHPRDLADGETAPAVLDYHGGGFFLTYAGPHLARAAQLAADARCRVFFPDYRLSTRHAFPAGFDDSFATLRWVHAQAEALGVDTQRVAVLGDSAGGALAAGVAQRAHDEGSLPICAQVLIYPVTDHETKTPSALRFRDTPLWKTSSNRMMWKLYLRDSEHVQSGGSAPAPPYAAPLHRRDFEGLPPAFVEVAEFDPLHDEGVAYAEALEAAGVPVRLHRVNAAVHGYDGIEGSPVADAVYKERLAALQRFFGRD